jgi:hypothetical protein
MNAALGLGFAEFVRPARAPRRRPPDPAPVGAPARGHLAGQVLADLGLGLHLLMLPGGGWLRPDPG